MLARFPTFDELDEIGRELAARQSQAIAEDLDRRILAELHDYCPARPSGPHVWTRTPDRPAGVCAFCRQPDLEG